MFKFYQKLIIELTDCHTDEVVLIEQLMRDDNGGTLDHLSRKQFDAAAKKALREIRWCGESRLGET
jgi:hypothetical protein